jgi:hypothetical protein
MMMMMMNNAEPYKNENSHTIKVTKMKI